MLNDGMNVTIFFFCLRICWESILCSDHKAQGIDAKELLVEISHVNTRMKILQMYKINLKRGEKKSPCRNNYNLCMYILCLHKKNVWLQNEELYSCYSVRGKKLGKAANTKHSLLLLMYTNQCLFF